MYLVIWRTIAVFENEIARLMSSVRGFDAIAVAKPLTCLLGARLWSLYIYTIVLYSAQQYIYYIGLRFDPIFRKTEYQSYRSRFSCFLWRSIQPKRWYLFLFFFIPTHALTHSTHRYSKTVYINEANCENRECLVDSLFFAVRRLPSTEYLFRIRIS